MVEGFGLTYSLADQNFAQTKSVGIFNLSLNLLPGLAERNEIDPLIVLSNRTLGAPPGLPARAEVRFHDQAVRGKIGRIYWDQWGVYRAAASSAKASWLFLPKGFASFLARPPVPLACYVHDASHEFYREHYPSALSRTEAWYFEKSFAATLQRANLLFTNSEFSRTELVRIARNRGWKIAPVRVAGIGFSAPAGPLPGGKREHLVVLTSRWPHKRGDLAAEFLSKWQEETGYQGSVIWVGELPAGLAFPGFARWVHHRRLGEKEFRRLIGEARGLLYFSDYEGFGMPPVESILGGTCPVYSDLPATREVMGGAGCAFRNDSYESFRAAMRQAAQTSAGMLDAWREELLRRHNWPDVTRRVAEGLAELTPHPERPRLIS